MKDVALVGVGLVVGFAAGYWVARRGQPVVEPPAVVEQESESQVSCREEKIPNSFSELSLESDDSPSANESA